MDRALTSTNRERRRERSFPDQLVVYFVILMGIFSELPYLLIMEKLAAAFSWLQLGADGLGRLSEPAIVQARQRVGAEPLRELFRLFAQPLATADTPGAFFHGRRLVVVDGSTFTVSDSNKNARTYGRPANQSGSAGMPQIRCVALIEYATRVFTDVIFGPYDGSSEQALAPQVLSRLKPGMLCLADRLYPGYELCKLVLDAGADFVWRVRRDFKLLPVRSFSDGSYEARIYLHVNRKKQKEYISVRVVKYRVDDDPGEIRLITSLMEPSVSALELAQLYPARWAEETTYRELKSILRCRNLVLRSQSPEMVEQELYGLFLGHFVVRQFMLHASNQSGIPPDHLSFRRAIHLVKESLPKIGTGSGFSPGRTRTSNRERASRQALSNT